MIVTCTNCATRLQLDDAKVPARAFTVRCPKCQRIITAEPQAAASDNSALGTGGDLPVSSRLQRGATSAPAPQFKFESGASEAATPAEQPGDASDLARMLAALLRQGGAGAEMEGRAGARTRPIWDRRRALVCISTAHGHEIARGLATNNYEVFVAADLAQAVERLRESKIEVVVVDPEFDMGRQGAAQLGQEMNTRRPAERRRMVVVEVSPTVRTGDGQAAFYANVNLVVNTNDVAALPHSLERNINELNDLYKDFNRALGLSEL